MRSTRSACRRSWSRCTAAKAEQRDRAARALFSATEMVSGNKFETEFGRTVPQTKYRGVCRPLPGAFPATGAAVATSLPAESQRGDLTKVAAKTDLRDAWGTRLRVERLDWDPQNRYYLVRSAGPGQAIRHRRRSGRPIWKFAPAEIAGPPTAGSRHRSPDRTRSRTLQRAARRSRDRWRTRPERRCREPPSPCAKSPPATTRTATTNAAGQFTLAATAAGRVRSPACPRRASRSRREAVTLKRARPGRALRHLERRRGDRNGGGRAGGSPPHRLAACVA